MSTPLLPCPFCGGIPRRTSNGYDDENEWPAHCPTRGCAINGLCIVSKEWNTRAPSPASSAPLPAARGVVITPEMEDEAGRAFYGKEWWDSYLNSHMKDELKPHRKLVRAAISAALSQGGGGEDGFANGCKPGEHDWITCQHDPANQSCSHCFNTRPTPREDLLVMARLLRQRQIKEASDVRRV